MHQRTRAVSVIALVVACLAAQTATAAEPTAADRDSARRLMAEGREKRDANDLKGALQRFAAADGIMHVPTTGLELARTQAALGQLVDARDTAVRASHIASEKHEPPQFAPARDAARTLSEELAKRIPTLKVIFHGAPESAETRVTVDGVEVPPAAIVVPRPVDPGHHHVSATSGTRVGASDVEVLEGESKEVDVELAEAPAPAPAPTPIAAVPAVPASPPPARSGMGKPLMIGGLGVAVLGGVVGSVAGLLSVSKTSSVKDSCRDGRCPPSSAAGIDSAGSAATISDIGFIAAGVGAAVGIVGLVLWRRDAKAAEQAPQALRVTPWFSAGTMGGGSAGLGGSF